MTEIILLVALGLGLFAGWHKGLVRQLGSLLGFFVALIISHVFGDAAASLAATIMDTDSADTVGMMWAGAVGRIVLFILVWWTISLIARLVHSVLKAVKLGGVNSLLGAVLMTLKVLVVESLLLNLWTALMPQTSDYGPVANTIASIGPVMLGYVTDNF